MQKCTLQTHPCKALSEDVTPSKSSGILLCILHCRADGVESLSREASENRDLLVIRGLEDYKNLPNKSLRLMSYALSSPAGWATTCTMSAVHTCSPCTNSILLGVCVWGKVSWRLYCQGYPYM